MAIECYHKEMFAFGLLVALMLFFFTYIIDIIIQERIQNNLNGGK